MCPSWPGNQRPPPGALFCSPRGLSSLCAVVRSPCVLGKAIHYVNCFSFASSPGTVTPLVSPASAVSFEDPTEATTACTRQGPSQRRASPQASLGLRRRGGSHPTFWIHEQPHECISSLFSLTRGSTCDSNPGPSEECVCVGGEP